MQLQPLAHQFLFSLLARSAFYGMKRFGPFLLRSSCAFEQEMHRPWRFILYLFRFLKHQHQPQVPSLEASLATSGVITLFSALEVAAEPVTHAVSQIAARFFAPTRAKQIASHAYYPLKALLCAGAVKLCLPVAVAKEAFYEALFADLIASKIPCAAHERKEPQKDLAQEDEEKTSSTSEDRTRVVVPLDLQYLAMGSIARSALLYCNGAPHGLCYHLLLELLEALGATKVHTYVLEQIEHLGPLDPARLPSFSKKAALYFFEHLFFYSLLAGALSSSFQEDPHRPIPTLSLPAMLLTKSLLCEFFYLGSRLFQALGAQLHTRYHTLLPLFIIASDTTFYLLVFFCFARYETLFFLDYAQAFTMAAAIFFAGHTERICFEEGSFLFDEARRVLLEVAWAFSLVLLLQYAYLGPILFWQITRARLPLIALAHALRTITRLCLSAPRAF